MALPDALVRLTLRRVCPWRARVEEVLVLLVDRRTRWWRIPVAMAVALPAIAGCSFFGGDGTSSVNVFDVKPGDCFRPPADVTVELTDLSGVACDQPHEQEAYALVEYSAPGAADAPAATDAPAETPDAGGTFPGDAPLKDFADGACAEQFADYVGVDYRDSSLFFTYLVPSARSWEDDGDRTVICFVTTTGEELTQSVAGTGW